VVGAAACEPQGCVPEGDQLNLQFWQREAPQELLASKYANVGETGRAWDDYDLPPELLHHSLGSFAVGWGVDVAYQSENLRSEPHLYVRNPREIKETIAAYAASGALQVLPGLWSDLTAPERRPDSVSLPVNVYSENNKRQLYAEDFYAAAPASIQAVRVYNHGACSKEVLTTGPDGLLDKVGESLWRKFAEQSLLDDDKECRTWVHPYRVFSSSMNYLDHRAGEQTDLRGGFFLHFQYGAVIDVFFADNLTFNYTTRYEYTLSQGILALGSYHYDGFASGFDAEEYADDLAGAFGDCTKTNCTDIPKGFYQAAKEEQTRYILGQTALSLCAPDVYDPCGDVVSYALLGVDSGASTLETLGMEFFSDDDRDAMKAAMARHISDDPSLPLKDWTCIPTEPNGDLGHCAFTLPAKRLNVYPDSVELVWFDGKEVNNPAYALYVAAHRSTGTNPSNGAPIFDQAKVDELCAYTPSIAVSSREFAMSNQGFAGDAPFISDPVLCANGYDTSPDPNCSFRGLPTRRSAWDVLPLLGLLLALGRRQARREERAS
jgi:hypothetical protein